MPKHAAEYADTMTKSREEVNAVNFPGSADDAAQGALSAIDTELRDMAAIDSVTAHDDAKIAFTVFDISDIRTEMAFAKLGAALGHPPSPARIALNKTNLARSTALLADARAVPAKKDAINQADLSALKAINATEEATYRDYLSSVSSIAFPEGQGPKKWGLDSGIGPMVSEYKQRIEGVLARDAQREKAGSVDEFLAGQSDWDNQPVERAWDKLTDGLTELAHHPDDPAVTPEPPCP